MKKGWHNYLIYISLVFLILALIKADYLKIPVIHSRLLLLASFSLLFVGFIVNTVSQYNSWRIPIISFVAGMRSPWSD